MIYHIREAIRGLLQAKLMTFVSIVTIAVSLTVLGVAVAGMYHVRRLIQTESQKVDMVVYLADGLAVDSAGRQALLGQLKSRPEIGSMVYVDKATAWSRFSALYGREMLDAVDKNPLPASIELALLPDFRDGEKAQSLAASLAGYSGVENVDFSRDAFKRLQQIRKYLTAAVVALIVLCFLILHFVVSNTVKLTIYARKELVTTMRLVGATDTFISIPFLVEGMLQGFCGALIGIAGLWLLQMAGRAFVPVAFPQFFFPALLITGVIFGWLGSASAVRKFLD